MNIVGKPKFAMQNRGKTPSINPSDVVKFKSLLEYFVAHLEYLQYENKKYQVQRGRGYAKYILPILPNFKKTGQGYKGDAIQNQISQWEQYSCAKSTSGKIFINVQINHGNKTTATNYLCWEGTYYNILAKWAPRWLLIKSVILELSIEDKTPQAEKKLQTMSIAELGLFDGNPPNENLQSFWNYYSKFA
ncbi:MAG: hypothetical protein IKO57_08475 [Treponema sp.]|nr:hypothetical protein [Treponema sp.]